MTTFQLFASQLSIVGLSMATRSGRAASRDDRLPTRRHPHQSKFNLPTVRQCLIVRSLSGCIFGPHARPSFGKVDSRYARPLGEDAREVRREHLRRGRRIRDIYARLSSLSKTNRHVGRKSLHLVHQLTSLFSETSTKS